MSLDHIALATGDMNDEGAADRFERRELISNLPIQRHHDRHVEACRTLIRCQAADHLAQPAGSRDRGELDSQMDDRCRSLISREQRLGRQAFQESTVRAANTLAGLRLRLGFGLRGGLRRWL